MKTVLVANPKGGCGKTTIATNLAGWFARCGRRVILADLDRQRSALGWLERRPARLPTIHAWDARRKPELDFPFRPEVVILDAPAGLSGERLKTAIRHADHTLVPVQPSPFDTDATDAFLGGLADLKRVRKGRCTVALLGNRVNARTLSGGQLRRHLATLGVPVLGELRDAQVYVQLAQDGTTLFDLPAQRADRDRLQWQGVLDWLQGR